MQHRLVWWVVTETCPKTLESSLSFLESETDSGIWCGAVLWCGMDGGPSSCTPFISKTPTSPNPSWGIIEVGKRKCLVSRVSSLYIVLHTDYCGTTVTVTPSASVSHVETSESVLFGSVSQKKMKNSELRKRQWIWTLVNLISGQTKFPNKSFSQCPIRKGETRCENGPEKLQSFGNQSCGSNQEWSV